MIPSKQWVAKCCHPDIDGGPLTIGEGDNWGKCWFITIRKLQSISREERYVVDGDGIKEDVRVPFDNVVHLQTRRLGERMETKAIFQVYLQKIRMVTD